MKLVLVLFSILFASVTCLPVPEEAVPVEKDIKSELAPKENPTISKEPLKLEENSTPITEKDADKKIDPKANNNNEADKKNEDKSTNNSEKVEVKKSTETEKEKKDNNENKVVIIEAKSVVNKEPEPMKNIEKDVKNEEILEKKEKVEIPAIVVTENTISTSTIKPKDDIDSNSNESTEKNIKTESKEDTPSSESKESAESHENKS